MVKDFNKNASRWEPWLYDQQERKQDTAQMLQAERNTFLIQVNDWFLLEMSN